jgi:hypothetical protein
MLHAFRSRPQSYCIEWCGTANRGPLEQAGSTAEPVLGGEYPHDKAQGFLGEFRNESSRAAWRVTRSLACARVCTSTNRGLLSGYFRRAASTHRKSWTHAVGVARTSREGRPKKSVHDF